ncbi:hypothetical protein RDABS01_026527 [Bienertia sinuspersici]
MNAKDCSLRLCSTFCPEWCDGIFPPPGPPPPPTPFTFPDDKSESSPTFSPLVIAIIGILASAFLLVSYYAIISKYCGKSSQRSRDVQRSNNEELLEEDYDVGNTNNNTQHHHHHEAWLINTPGLDEALIKNITLVKFKKGDGLIGTTDCSVCLGEFLEDDTLRLLPKCSHAFHVACIDTWLRSHMNCPLCRANIISTFSQPPPNNTNNNPHLAVDTNNNNNNNNVIQNHSILLDSQEETSSSGEERQMDVIAEQPNGNLPKTPFRALSDLGARGHGGSDTMRRSISMDHRYETRVSIPDVYICSHGEDCIVKICQLLEQSTKRTSGESSKFSTSSSNRNGVLHCVKSGVAMNRSFSSGRFLFSKHVRGKNAISPL